MVDSFLLTVLGIGCVRAGECLRTCQPAPFFLPETIRAASSLVKELFGFRNSLFNSVKIIGTTEAARRLGVSDARVRALIESGRLKAVKIGGTWLIDPKDLKAVKVRKVGRPKTRKSTKKRGAT